MCASRDTKIMLYGSQPIRFRFIAFVESKNESDHQRDNYLNKSYYGVCGSKHRKKSVELIVTRLGPHSSGTKEITTKFRNSRQQRTAFA